MNRRRKTHRGLTNTRIYPKNKRYYLFSPSAIENPNTGKVAKWHSLCPIDKGEDEARTLAKAIIEYNKPQDYTGDLPIWLEKYCLATLKRREKDRPREAARVAIFEANNKEIRRICNTIKTQFTEFDVDQVLPVDVATFVDQWEGQRMAQIYLSRLSDFFAWCARKGLRSDNPCREVKVEKPVKRTRYITDQEYYCIYDALLKDVNGKTVPSGAMVQCYVDLCYLLYQRTTEIRLLKWSDVKDDGIYFKPTKTENSSGAKVFVPISPAVKDVLDRAKAIGKIKSMYVIHTMHGMPYQSSGLRTAWDRACKRAGIVDATLKDLRAKALTDAKKAGYQIEQLRIAAAHSDTNMTNEYIKRRETPVSEVILNLPARS